LVQVLPGWGLGSKVAWKEVLNVLDFKNKLEMLNTMFWIEEMGPV
jgi:hypothetical protein